MSNCNCLQGWIKKKVNHAYDGVEAGIAPLLYTPPLFFDSIILFQKFHCVRYREFVVSHYFIQNKCKLSIFFNACWICFSSSQSFTGTVWREARGGRELKRTGTTGFRQLRWIGWKCLSGYVQSFAESGQE